MAILETFYILCRKSSWEEAKVKIDALIKSNIIKIIPISNLIEHAALIKCERAIAIADCLTIALAKSLNGAAIFFDREKELEIAMKKNLSRKVLSF